ncbi:activator of 90 kDa heat shock protein ATPase homolog 1-like [Saccostrea cucullata]|uniref:activator of 90 kDa heat shock protein ATPase homolog 1-like n=1 Tax=Saccostrea cuccullata TaxID=36930 RepID=UPI002ED15516
MAKWGEGDPRWIVEERPDGTNVNNWHWVEKNATGWSKDRLKELLTGIVIEDDKHFCEIKEVTSIEGEASANNRKAKLIFFYEFVIKGEWSGKFKDSDKKYKGKFEIPNLSEENDTDEIDFNVTVSNDSDEAFKLKEFLRKTGVTLVRQKMADYLNDLRHEYSKGVVLPTKGGQQAPAKTVAGTNKSKEEMNKHVVDTKVAKPLGVKIHTKKIVGKEEFKCRAEDLYRALTDVQMVQAFSASPVEMEVEKGGRFSLLHGNITGDFVELIPNQKIVQHWRVKSWPDAHYSTVTFEFDEKDDCTVLNYTQTGVPDTEYEKTKEGWAINYWNRMKQVFGFGSSIY